MRKAFDTAVVLIVNQKISSPMKRLLICVFAAAFSLHAEMSSEKQELPRVMVILEEKIDTVDAASHKASAKIESALKAHGYRVIEAKQFEIIRQRDSTMRDMNPKKAAALARRLGAEILVTGGVTAMQGGGRETYGFKSFVYAADASMKAMATETGEVLGFFTASAEKASQSKPTAAFKTLDAVGDSLGEMLCMSLRQAFEASQEKSLELIVQGVDDAVLQKIAADLPAAAPALRTAAIRFMEGDAATFDCTTRNSADDVRKQLGTAKNFVVTGFSGSRIDVLYRARVVKRTAVRVSNGLEITRFTSENIFPARALHYVRHPIGTVVVKNTSAGEITNITARIFITGFTSDVSEQTIPTLKPGEEKPIAVFALLDAEKLAMLPKETTLQIRVDLRYESAGEEYSRVIIKPVLMLNKHAIAWSTPASVASFVTPESDAIISFTRPILADVRHDAVLLPSSSVTMMNAVKMWNALQAMSFTYAGTVRAAGKDALDDVRYPQETLAMRSGGCDDTSVLLAACLESVGVPTAIAITSDYVFVLFDTGVLKKNAVQISTDEKKYVVRAGTVWIPLETTMANTPFLSAWKEGMKDYSNAAMEAKHCDIVDIHTAWRQYPPIDLASDVMQVSVPQSAAVSDLVSSDVKAITQDLMNQIDAEAASLRQQQTESGANRAAMLLTVANKYDEASGVLKNYVTSASLNNLGNVYFLKGDSLNAVKAYQSALKADHTDAGIVMNLGVLNYFGGDEDAAALLLRQGVELLDAKDRLYEMFGLVAGNDAGTERKAVERKKATEKTELKRLLDAALKDAAAKKQKDPLPVKTRRGENKFIFGGRRGIDPSAVIALKDILYWKMPA
jgi:Flp pilus assembly protein TadD